MMKLDRSFTGSVRVDFTEEDRRRALEMAHARQAMNERKQLLDRHGATGGVRLHILGILAEAAVSRYWSIPWDGNLGRYGVTDVGPLQVKAVPDPRYNLRVNHWSKENDIFVSCYVESERVVWLRGWMRGGDAKITDWWHAPVEGRACYLVPNRALRAFDEPEFLDALRVYSGKMVGA